MYKRKILRLLKCLALIGATVCIMGIIGSAVLQLYYQEFYHTATREFEIPGLEEGFVPQGLDYCEEYNLYLLCGYRYPDEQAQIYVVQPDGTYHKILALDEQGKTLVSHAGGIAHNDKFVYLAGCDGKCYVFSFEELMQEQVTQTQMLGYFQVWNQADYCCIKEGELYIGEYYHTYKYGTDSSHHYISTTGEEHYAIITAFSLNEERALGVNKIPELALSVTGRIQGMCFDNNNLILSASSAFEGSQLYVYDYQKALTDVSEKITILGTKLPVFFLDANNMTKSIEILPKSEGITLCNDRLLMSFESASKKFLYGKLLKGEYVYSIPLEVINK